MKGMTVQQIEYNGAMRFVHKRATYPTPPELGTIVGPNDLGEHFVVVGTDGRTSLLSYATVPDLTTARTYVFEHGPRSVTETTMVQGAVPGEVR